MPVIKIFDISQPDDPFWRSVARELNRSDKYYRMRLVVSISCLRATYLMHLARCTERSVSVRKAKGILEIPPVVRARVGRGITFSSEASSAEADQEEEETRLKVSRRFANPSFQV